MAKPKCVDETQLSVVVQIFFFKAKNGPQFCCPPDLTPYSTQRANYLPEGSSYKIQCGGHGLQTPGKEITFTAGLKSTPSPKFLGTAEAYFVYNIDQNFQISLIYAFIGCP